MDEILDLYDREGRRIGQTVRRPGVKPEVPKGAYWRVCDAWIVRSDGQLLVQKRQADKQPWPGYWAESAGGSVISGETPEQGCLREAREELGIVPDMERGMLAFEFLTENAIHDVWVFFMDVSLEALTLQPEEVEDAKYVSPAELRRMVRQGEAVPIGYLDQLLNMLPILRSAYEPVKPRKDDLDAEIL